MATQLTFRNPSTTHSVKLIPEDAVMAKDPKDETKLKPTGQWKASPNYTIVKPNESGSIYVQTGLRRFRIEELPT